MEATLNTQETVLSFILKNELKRTANRLEDLRKISAPEVIIEAVETSLEKLQNGTISINDKDNVLGLICTGCTQLVGRGGKTYVVVNTAEGIDLNYFPHGQYGAFIKKAKS